MARIIKLPEGYITYAEASKRMDRSKSEVARFVREGRVTACKRGEEYQYCCGVLAEDIDRIVSGMIIVKNELMPDRQRRKQQQEAENIKPVG